MQILNNGKFITISDNGSNPDLNLVKLHINSVGEKPFIGNVNFSQANPSNKQNYVSFEIIMNDGRIYDFSLYDITNQPGWTTDMAGLKQAVTDVTSWL